MTPLEHRYRRVLRLLPADYRVVWEEDMVDTFLLSHLPDDQDDAEFEAEHGRPSWSETVSVAGLATRLRLGGTQAPPRSFARGQVVRHVALAGLLVHAVTAIVGVVALLVTQAEFPVYRVSDLDTALALTGLLWTGSYLALIAGHRRVACWVGTVALVPLVVSTASDAVAGGLSVASAIARLLSAVLPLLALAAFHREAPPVRARPWLVALPVGVVLTAAVAYATQSPDVVVLDGPGMLCVALTIAGLGYLTSGRTGPWTGALPVLAVGVLAERAASLVDYAMLPVGETWSDLLITFGLLEAGALVLVMTPLVVRCLATRPALA